MGSIIWMGSCGVLMAFLFFIAILLSSISVGYVSKIACSAVFVGKRSEATLWTDELHILSGLPYYLTFLDIDHDTRSVRASSWFSLLSKTAVFVPGLGCHLEFAGPTVTASPELVKYGESFDENALQAASKHASESVDWPLGDQGATATLESPARQKALEQLVEGLFKVGWSESRTHALLIVQRGKIVAERYADQVNVTRDTRLPGWSMTKTVLGTLCGVRLHQHDQFAEMDGRFKRSPRRFTLTRPVAKQLTHDQGPDRGRKMALVPQWANATDGRQRITVRHLLQMNDGLTWDESYTPVTDVTKMLFLHPDAAAFAADKPSEHEPGHRWRYSSGASNVLSAALRASFDRNWDYWSFPRRSLFQPLGMHSATLETDTSGTFVGSSYMHATARDWARLGLLWLRRGHLPQSSDGLAPPSLIWSPSFFEDAIKPAPHSNGVYGSGHLWLRHPHPDQLSATDATKYGWHQVLPKDCFFAHGFRDQIVMVCPENELVVVRLGHGKNGAFEEEPFFDQLFKIL